MSPLGEKAQEGAMWMSRVFLWWLCFLKEGIFVSRVTLK